MSDRNFRQMLEKKWGEGKFACVGLDSDYRLIPAAMRRRNIADTIFEFNVEVVEQTKDLVCAYKPNIAFYEAYGYQGLEALGRTFHHINHVAPDVPIILDAKRADIGKTNEGYVRAGFDFLLADAITVHPYLGGEALKPFLDRADKGIFVLCRTSNPGAGELQDLMVKCPLADQEYPPEWPLYQHVAFQVAKYWNTKGNCALVVGATYPEELERVRQIIGDIMPILLPGVGTQQKGIPLKEQVKRVVPIGKDSCNRGIIVNASRAIIFDDDPRRETLRLHNLINQYR